MQTRLGSLIEAWTNTVVGFGVAWGANVVVLPWFGFQTSAGDSFLIAVVFTVISIVRSYLLRRLFNRLKGRYFYAARQVPEEEAEKGDEGPVLYPTTKQVHPRSHPIIDIRPGSVSGDRSRET